MKLRDLDAQLIAFDEGFGAHVVLSLDDAQAIEMICPKCAAGKPVEEEDGRRFVRGVHYLPYLAFRNPRRLPTVALQVNGHTGWWIEGTSLDDLTFAHGEPSQPKSIGIGAGNSHAHFFITNGVTHE